MDTRIKIIITNGIVTSVLANNDVEVEIIDVDSDYEDYEALKKYEEDIYKDHTLKEQPYKVAHFEADEEV